MSDMTAETHLIGNGMGAGSRFMLIAGGRKIPWPPNPILPEDQLAFQRLRGLCGGTITVNKLVPIAKAIEGKTGEISDETTREFEELSIRVQGRTGILIARLLWVTQNDGIECKDPTDP